MSAFLNMKYQPLGYYKTSLVIFHLFLERRS